jgi:hypothetical protein
MAFLRPAPELDKVKNSLKGTEKSKAVLLGLA